MRPVVRRLVALGTGLDHAVADVRLCAETSTATGVTEYDIREAPCVGTLDSLIARHRAGLSRLAGGGLRENLPPVRHDGGRNRQPTRALLFLLRTPADAESEQALPVAPEASAVLAHAIRHELACELREQLTRFSTVWPTLAPPLSTEDVERFVLGRGAGPNDKERRVSVLPLPSIGHEHADGLLRRVLVVIPTACPVAPEIARRALADAEIVVESSDGKRLARLRLVPAEQDDDPREQTMLRRFVGEARVWRTVSPIVLPGAGWKARGIADPAERAAMDERRRCREEALVHRAINDAGIDAASIAALRLRREPFGPHRPRADARWQLPRNSQGRCWLAGKPRLHAEIVFATKRPGPLAFGDGRYLGLGLMQPVGDAWRDVVVFGLASEPRISTADRGALLGAVRRALMSLSRQSDGAVPRLFSGHETDGAQAQSGRH
jgi:CRISPR-associated protein Csb2